MQLDAGKDRSKDFIGKAAKQLSILPCITYLDDVELCDGLISGSISNAIVVACSEMGWLVPYVCSSPSVKLYLFQNFGNTTEGGGIVETILKADIEHVIIYGHSDCASTRFQTDKLYGAGAQRPEDTFEQYGFDLYAALKKNQSPQALRELCQYNVLNQLQKLVQNPLIAAPVERGNLELHAWFFSEDERQLAVFRPGSEPDFVVRDSTLSEQELSFVPKEGLT